MVMRIIFLVMCGIIGKDFYQYSVEHSFAWIHFKYHIVFGVAMFCMLMLTRNKKFKY